MEKERLGNGQEDNSISNVWDNVLKQLQDVAATTVQQNKELTDQVKNLQRELEVWKLALSAVNDSAEQQKHGFDAEKQAMVARIGYLESAQDQAVLCVIDGDGNIFKDYLLIQGIEGGREAARILTTQISLYLQQQQQQPPPTSPSTPSPIVSNRPTLWVSIFFNRKGLQNTLVKHSVCSAEQFDAFLTGFSQASPMFHVVDVGFGKEAADSKIKEYIRFYSRYPQTLKIFFGGGHDNGYLPTLTALQNEHLLYKVVLIKGYNEIAKELDSLKLPILNLEVVFRPVKLPQSPRPVKSPLLRPVILPDSALQLTYGKPSDGSSPGPSRIEDDSGSIHLVLANATTLSLPATPKSTKSNDINQSPGTPTKKLNEKQPLWKQTPPCNEFYLLKRCPKGPACRYGHEYELDSEQIDILRQNTKKMQCYKVKKGLTCSFGDQCIYGHVCPYGAKCAHNASGKCWFKGPNAHPSTSPPVTQSAA